MMDLEKLLAKVLEGGFSAISVKKYITVVVASYYTDKYGQVPFYFGRNEFTVLACFGWGLRYVNIRKKILTKFGKTYVY